MEQRIKIGVDALPAIPGKSGAIGAIRNMIRLTPQIDNSIELTIFVTPLQYDYYKQFLPPEYSNGIKLSIVRVPGQALGPRIWAQNFVVPRLCHKSGIEVHFSMNPEPLTKISNIKEVFKVVDLQYHEVPEEFGIWKTAYRKWMGGRKVRRADLIIANSLYTKAKIMEYFGIGPERIQVVHEALDHGFFNTDSIDPMEVNSVKDRYSIDAPFIIYVSSFRPYKNHILLLQAFKKLKETGLPHQLVLVGNDIRGFRKKVEAKVAELGLDSCTHFIDFLHHWDLRLFYYSASLAVYPSDLETFGIPPLEAMACGLPVIVSDRTAIPEISGGGSLIVNPHNIAEMAESMHQVLTDLELNRGLRSRGQVWCRHFTWERNISETITLIRGLR